MINKAKEIANGYKNLLKYKLGISNKKDEEVFLARREVCNSCVRRDEKNDRCMECGCQLAAKTRSVLSKCDIGLW